MPRLKNHLPSWARNHKSLCALGQALHAPLCVPGHIHAIGHMVLKNFGPCKNFHMLSPVKLNDVCYLENKHAPSFKITCPVGHATTNALMWNPGRCVSNVAILFVSVISLICISNSYFQNLRKCYMARRPLVLMCKILNYAYMYFGKTKFVHKPSQ